MRVVNDVHVYGMQDSIRASKYPMAVDTGDCDDTITKGVQNRATAPMGTGHDQFLTGIIVQFDLTFSVKAWVEMQRYHFIDFVSSQSTMHRITRMEVNTQVNEYVDSRAVDIVNEKIKEYERESTPQNYLRVLYNIPVGFQLTARMTTNYRQLKTIYQQRKTHRLPEWRTFCHWIETLPHSEFITGA